MKTLLALPGLLVGALFAAARRPWVVALFLLLNLGVAVVLAAPLHSLLSAELDDNLYGEEMAEGASWRWFDTVERNHPEAVGDYSPWSAFFTPEGVGLDDLAAVSGPAAAVLLAALLLFLLHAPLHVGYLRVGYVAASDLAASDLAADDQAAGDHGARGVVAAGLARAPAALLLGLAAGVSYVAAYALLYVAPAAALERFSEFLLSSPFALAQTWIRLALTGLGFLAIKVFFDLAKLGLALDGGSRKIDRGEAVPDPSPSLGGLGRLPAALGLAVGESLRRGWAYLLVGLVLWTLALALGALWWWLSAPLVPSAWLGIVILFLLHQIFLALRIGLRLAQLDAVRGIHGHAAGRSISSPAPHVGALPSGGAPAVDLSSPSPAEPGSTTSALPEPEDRAENWQVNDEEEKS